MHFYEDVDWPAVVATIVSDVMIRILGALAIVFPMPWDTPTHTLVMLIAILIAEKLDVVVHDDPTKPGHRINHRILLRLLVFLEQLPEKRGRGYRLFNLCDLGCCLCGRGGLEFRDPLLGSFQLLSWGC